MSQKEKNKKSEQTCKESPDLSLLRRFQDSMIIDYEKWRDGVGYDLESLRKASECERQEIEKILIEHSPRDWRDIEALAQLNTSGAREALRSALEDGDAETRMAVSRYAPVLITEKKRAKSLVRALKTAKPFEGLASILDEVEEFHPPEVIDALIQGVLKQEGEVAVHFAAMLLFLHGKAESSFDMGQRPFLLSFNTDQKAERKKAFDELLKRIGRNS